MPKNHILLTNAAHIFTGVGADMRYNKPKHEFPMHNHEFHEIVFISNGSTPGEYIHDLHMKYAAVL